MSIEATEYDEGVDLNNLPPAPWTPLALGELFYRLARIAGAESGHPLGTGTSLSPRTFARSRFFRLLRLQALELPPATAEFFEHGQQVERPLTEKEKANWYELRYPDPEKREWAVGEIARLQAEAIELQAMINEKLPPISGLPRRAGADKLRPSEVTKKTRTRVY